MLVWCGSGGGGRCSGADIALLEPAVLVACCFDRRLPRPWLLPRCSVSERQPRRLHAQGERRKADPGIGCGHGRPNLLRVASRRHLRRQRDGGGDIWQALRAVEARSTPASFPIASAGSRLLIIMYIMCWLGALLGLARPREGRHNGGDERQQQGSGEAVRDLSRAPRRYAGQSYHAQNCALHSA